MLRIVTRVDIVDENLQAKVKAAAACLTAIIVEE